MSMMFPGSEPVDLTSKLRWRVDIQSHSTVNGWKTLFSRVPAAFEVKRGGEMLTNEMNFPSRTVIIRVRYHPKNRIYAHMRVVFTSPQGVQYFTINSVGVHEEKRRSVVLLCEELDDVGAVK